MSGVEKALGRWVQDDSEKRTNDLECNQVMSDNGPAYLSRSFAKACKALGLKHIRTRPYTPRTNGKAEWFIQTLCKEWAYAMAFQNSKERDNWLPRYLSISNRGETRIQIVPA
jgi:transposase InsO family protein